VAALVLLEVIKPTIMTQKMVQQTRAAVLAVVINLVVLELLLSDTTIQEFKEINYGTFCKSRWSNW
jgi:hypothetical protein